MKPDAQKCPGVTFYLLVAISAIIVFGRLPNIPAPFSDPAQYPHLQEFILVEDIAAIILILAAALGLNALIRLLARKLGRRCEIPLTRRVKAYIPPEGDWELPQDWRN